MGKDLIIGLIAAPELPEEIVNKFLNDLPEVFKHSIDGSISWDVEMVVDPLTGAAEDVDVILDETLKIRNEKGWDYAISLTDLPIYYGEYVVAADNSYQNKIAQISIPAFGWLSLQGSIKNAIIHILKELIFYAESARDNVEAEQLSKKVEKDFPIYKAKRIRPSSHSTKANVRYVVVPKWDGKIRLIIGMTKSNRPMSIMGSFKKVLAAAFTTGAFGLIFTTMWNLGIILSTLRLSGLMVAAVSAIIIWIIFNHDLWEGPSAGNEKKMRRLYNVTTLSTLFISVITYYVLLWIFFLTAALVLIPPEVLMESVSIEGDPSVIHYIRVAWVATSISTMAGAIGAGMENEEMVRDITYGYRQKRRYNRIQN
ncbi:5,10-methylene-tetrahydrofolate dehydrogenase [Virgibacillus oceani]